MISKIYAFFRRFVQIHACQHKLSLLAKNTRGFEKLSICTVCGAYVINGHTTDKKGKQYRWVYYSSADIATEKRIRLKHKGV
jgi:hypothetical protein